MGQKKQLSHTGDDFGGYLDGEDKIDCTYSTPEQAEEAVLKRILAR